MSKKTSPKKRAQGKRAPSADGRLGPHRVGDKVVIRAVPFHYIGQILALGEHAVTLAPGAVWLADSGRWSDMLIGGRPNESEPYPDGVSILYGVVADVAPWGHQIPGKT